MSEDEWPRAQIPDLDLVPDFFAATELVAYIYLVSVSPQLPDLYGCKSVERLAPHIARKEESMDITTQEHTGLKDQD